MYTQYKNIEHEVKNTVVYKYGGTSVKIGKKLST